MPQPERFEILILGSGEAGKLLAWHLGHAGRRVAVVERRWIGGSCPNIACLPTKNEITSARIAHLARHAGHFGTMTGAVSVDMAKVVARKRGMVEREVAHHKRNYQEASVELVMGNGRFVAPKTLEVRLNAGGTRLLTGERVFLNLGSHALIPDIQGLATAQPLTHIEALELDRLPEHLIVLGGGYVGIELAQAFRRFGSAVTVVEAGKQPMSREDPDVAAEIQRILENEGIRFRCGVRVEGVEGRSGEEVGLSLRTPSGAEHLAGTDLLVAAGRIPNTADIGLDHAGVQCDERGFIRVDDRLQTTAPGVWAMGECAGTPLFTHASHDDFRVIRDNLAGGNHSTRGRLIPFCMFTDPPLARVGLSEIEAQRLGIAVRVARLPTGMILRTQATDETKGFLKALVAPDDDRILGFTMIGAEAGEVMSAVHVAMLADLPYPRLRDAVIAHPTMAEGLGPLFERVPPR